MRQKRTILGILLAALLFLTACTDTLSLVQETNGAPAEASADAGSEETAGFWYEAIPPYTGNASVSVNEGIPFFLAEEVPEGVFEEYAPLDALGRCGTAFANVCLEIMPTEERGSIGSVKPTGWHTVKYEVIADRYLYNRCHLIGFQLAGENANEQNLITGTRYLNVEGMLPWENQVAEYVHETGNHVLYRVTPFFEGDNLVASGVLMEAFSVEDEGAGICFNVYCYNVQPGIAIDYATGESRLEKSGAMQESAASNLEYDYVLNTNTRRFHDPSCSSVSQMKAKNRENYSGERENLIEEGYLPCNLCQP